MSRWARARIKIASTFLICLASISSAPTAMACSVCYGDPNSPLTKGVDAGVLVLLAFVGVILLLLASLLVFWTRRAAHLGETGLDVGKSNGAFTIEARGSS